MLQRALAFMILCLLALSTAAHAEEGASASESKLHGAEAAEQGELLTFGPVRFLLPMGWVRREGTPDDNPHYDAPGPSPGLGPTVAFVIEDTRPGTPPAEEGTVITGSERRRISGHLALVQRWYWEEDDTQGVTLFVRNVEPGKTLKVYGWIGRTDWQARNAELWSVLNSISFADGETPETAQAGRAASPETSAEPPVTPATRPWRLGLVTLSAPQSWQAVIPPQPLSFGGGDWELMLAEDPASPKTGGFLLLTWAEQPVLHSAELDPVRILSTRPATLAGQNATRTDFGPGGSDDVRGFDAITDAPLSGGYLVISCRMPTAMWVDAGRSCEEVLESLSIGPEAPPETAAGSPATEAPEIVKAASAPQEAPEETQSETLFSGSLDPLWVPYASAGGNYEQFASLQDGMLRVEVPVGNAWGKTGIQSRAPVLEPWAPGDRSLVKLTLGFDPSCTSSFVATLAARSDSDEWNASGIRFAWSRQADGAQGGTAAWSGGYMVMQGKRGPEAPENVVITIGGDGVAVMELPDGQHIEAIAPYDLHRDALYLYVLAHAPGEGSAAAMCLRSVATQRVTPPEPAGKGTATATLFDGLLGRTFVANSSQGGVFADHARLTPDGLIVDVPKQSGWGKVGIVAREPVLWLDGWTGKARATLSYRFDPAKTTGFLIILATRARYDPGTATGPDAPALQLHWRQTADGKGARLGAAWAGSSTALVDVELPSAAPEDVKLFLRPQGVIIAAGSTYVSDLITWPDLSEGQALRTWVLSLPDAVDMPVRMALRSIDLERTAAGDAATASPRLDPLPVRSLFTGAQSTDWEPIGVAGGDFDKFASWGAGGLVVSVPEGNSWGKTGIISAQPIISLDQRFFSTGVELTLAVDKAATTGFAAAIGGSKQADMWPTYRLWASFIRRDDGSYDLVLDWGGTKTAARNLPAQMVERQWDGTMHIVLNPGSSELRLGGIDQAIRSPDHFNPGDALYMSVQSHPAAENGAAQLSLSSIASQWLLPDGASALDRMSYLEDDDFDAVEFLRLTREEIDDGLQKLDSFYNAEAH